MSPSNQNFVNYEMRAVIHEALKANNGKVSETGLREFVTARKPGTSNQSISQLLRYMQRDDEIAVTGDWIRSKQVPPTGESAPAPAPYTNGNNEGRVTIPEFYRGRQGKKLIIERNREEMDDVFRLEYQMAGASEWQKIPTWGNIHVSIGVEQAVIDPEQEVYINIRKLRVTFTDGRVRTWDDLNPRDYVVIAPME